MRFTVIRYPCSVGSPQHRTLLLQFMNSLVLHLLVDDYIRGDYSDDTENHILLPPFVRHFLQAKCRDLDFNYIVSLVKVLFDFVLPHQHGWATHFWFVHFVWENGVKMCIKVCTLFLY